MSDWINRLPLIVNKIKYQLYAKKFDDLEKLSATLYKFDKNGNGVFDKNEFTDLLCSIGIFLSTQEMSIIYKSFDANQDGSISFMEFVQALRTSMSDYRMEVVQNAFDMLDVQKKGCLTLQDLKARFVAENHPRVKTREKSAGEVRADFEFAIDNKSTDGQTLTREQWVGYYADINACLPNEREDHFSDVVKNTWNLVLAERAVRDSRLTELEKILFEKIRQRTVGTDNEGATLRRKFNYVDTYDEGLVDQKQFKMAMVELGCLFEDHELHALFQMYSNNQPRLSYNDMCTYFKDLGLQAEPNLNPAYKEYRRLPENALNMIKNELSKRGYFGISILRRIFERADKNGNAVLERSEFIWCLKECNINMTKTDYEKIFRFFDQNGDNSITFTEFIEAITEPLSERRKDVIKQAYDMLRQSDEMITKDRIQKHFNPVKQPEIEAGYMTKNEVLREFLALFGDVSAKGIPFDSWDAVFTDISSNFKTDDQFEGYMKSLWGVSC